MRPSGSLSIFLLALGARLAFVAWAPGEPTGDGIFYHQHGVDLAAGNGYVNLDRSPANTWMPGWPALLAGLYSVFGVHARLAMSMNALLGALTAVGVAGLGQRLFGARAGLAAGCLYALWPGLIYFSATLFNEALFSLLFIVALNLAVDATRATSRPLLRYAATGLALGACALVKSEPLVLCLPIAVWFYAVRVDTRHFLLASTVCFGVTLACVAPWTLRNYQTFDRFIPTAAGGGMAVAAANHPGASGGNDLVYLLAYLERLGVSDATQAEQTLALHDHAWTEVRGFASSQPVEALHVVGRKLALTYGGDAGGAELVRGHFGRANWFLDEVTWRRLAVIADTVWWSGLVLFGVGLLALARAPSTTRLLLGGLLACWFGLHVVFMGGMRFHVPELLVVILIAGLGVDWLLGRPDSKAADLF
jgi:4-amino-4-deoxy-L-arabinose transferase-like glycosyltransferase